ncbi:MAG: hypothetical protein Q8927_12655 [Bacteroidota bacterium]|nr:hypothetical protein [Bacteroidota bacterium]MDP4217043.1 hypothetical protein [Bacteroidota bacterium]MDP4244956.1 hypothetical protein [Bacteroidota bacterium]MDP4252512.1 hypothetical protein [Bacteroidota bacterium]MDP4260231.1 hypothetical protein [Bacteroidota bacterium]
MRNIMAITRLCALLLLARPAQSQLALTRNGALAALNSSLAASARNLPPVNPVSLATNPVPVPPVTKPVNLSNPVLLPQVMNDKTLWFTYRSPLTWWTAYFNYKTAAEGAMIGGFALMSHPEVAIAMAFLEDQGHFIPLQSFSPRQTTMTIRANDPVPVQFSDVRNINNATVSLREYVPHLAGFYAELPLSFPGPINIPFNNPNNAVLK